MKITPILLLLGGFLVILALFGPMAGPIASSLDAVIDSMGNLTKIRIPTTVYVKENGTLKEKTEIVETDFGPALKALGRVAVLAMPVVLFLVMFRKIR